ncbi:hypothetical protein [Verrucosispora sioxanthis]|uniref:hypothetical protein n=1 Tax=Verrucosispora sioxanthis TaxID=2499994 RepID=UPI001C104624|nr:hypothetical protein [Verrucosispora sioxanthis]
MRKTSVIALVAGMVAGLAGLGLMPRQPRLTAQTTGDADLAALPWPRRRPGRRRADPHRRPR